MSRGTAEREERLPQYWGHCSMNLQYLALIQGVKDFIQHERGSGF